MKILGIESSCDETAVAILDVVKEPRFGGVILSNTVYSQTQEHIEYGGVVPEIASRAHMELIDSLTKKSLDEAGLKLDDIDAFAATRGPGLLGGLHIGLTFGKSLAQAAGKPFLGVNHLEGHALTAHLTEDGMDFPYLLLLVSGGHCQFINVTTLGEYQTIGGTIDDAIGECFDKVAKMLGFSYPGGPHIEKWAKDGDSEAYKFPLPLQHKGVDFSFSGLKTAVRRAIENEDLLCEKTDLSGGKTIKANICASFQATVAEILAIKTKRAIEQVGATRFVLGGGVAANKLLRSRLEEVCTQNGVTFYAPPVKLCTDNAVMVAYAGGLRLLCGETSDMATTATPRWPLEELTAP